MPLRNGFLLLLLVISGCSSIGVPSFLSKNDAAIVTFSNGRDVANIPFTEINEQIVFDAVLNNNKKVRLLLDSGAQTSVLFETINIRKSSLKLVDSIEVGGMGGSDSTLAHITSPVALRMGGAKIEGLSFLFVDAKDNPFFSRPEMAYFDGIIGYDLFSKLALNINYDEKKFRLLNGSEEMPEGYSQLPLKIRSRLSFVNLEISTRSSSTNERAIVDTGAVGNVSLSGASLKPLEGEVLYEGKTIGLGGSARTLSVKFEEVVLGGHGIADVHGALSMKPESDGPSVLGTGILRRFNLVFDYPNQSLFLQPNKNFDTPDVPNLFGLTLIPINEGAIVLDVRESSAAEINEFKPNDVITKFDNIDIGVFQGSCRLSC